MDTAIHFHILCPIMQGTCYQIICSMAPVLSDNNMVLFCKIEEISLFISLHGKLVFSLNIEVFIGVPVHRKEINEDIKHIAGWSVKFLKELLLV